MIQTVFCILGLILLHHNYKHHGISHSSSEMKVK